MTHTQRLWHDFSQFTGRYRFPVICLGLVGILIIAGYSISSLMQADFGALGSYWPYLLLLLCPLMHVFMHHGHGHGHGGGRKRDDES